VKLRNWITAIVLLLLMALAVVGLVRTRPPAKLAEDDSGKTARDKFSAGGATGSQRQLVDQRPLETARRMAASASTPEEQALAHEAEKAADHEVDLAFYDALRGAEENPPKLTPEAKQLADRKSKAELAVKDDEESIAQLKHRLATAPASQKDNLQDQIDVAEAQQDLDQDELDDASEDLEQAGGDLQSKLKRLKAAHDESDHAVAQMGSAVDSHERDYQARTALAVFRAWKALREKKRQLGAAQDEAVRKAQRLGQRHNTLALQLEKEKDNREAAKTQARGFARASATGSREESKSGAQTALDSLKQYTRDQKNLADLGRRIQDENQLSEIYGSWIGLVETREQAALHNRGKQTLQHHAVGGEIRSAVAGCARCSVRRVRPAEPDHRSSRPGRRGTHRGEQRRDHGLFWMVPADGPQRNPCGRLG
jgi:hypothetical protein